MKKISYTFFLIIVGFISACCGKVDCSGGGYIKFRLLNKIDSSDLVFCSNKKYKTNNILLYTLSNNKIDTVHKSIFYNYANVACDSIMIAFFYNPHEKIYLKLDSNTVDTFNLTFNYYHSKCCSDGFEIKSLKYNSELISLDSTNSYNLFK